MKIGRIKKIDIILNDFFLLLVLAYGMLGVFFQAVMIFGLVILHETAHICAARRGGLKVKAVELFPFGGVARLEGMLEVSPALEAKVALAGPMSNFFLLGLGLFFHFKYNWEGPFYVLFRNANLTMGLFNLLPALPLDGGRVLRSYWAGKIGLAEATFKTLLWGKYSAVLLGLTGIAGLILGYNDLNIIVIAAFIYLAAAKYEEGTIYVFLRYLLRKNQELTKLGVLPVKQLAVTAKTTIKEVVSKFSPGSYHLIAVLDLEGNYQGQLTEHQLIAALFKRGSSCSVEKLL